MRRATIDIDSPKVRAFVLQNSEVFKLAMNGMVEAAQDPTASTEENIALLLRATTAFTAGIIKQFGITPEEFADLLHFFDEVKVTLPPRIRVPKGKPS